MQRLWDSDLGLVVAGKFLYLPLILDPSIALDLESYPPVSLNSAPSPAGSGPFVLKAHGSFFVKSVSLASLLEQYPVIDAQACGRVRQAVLNGAAAISQAESTLPDPKLAVILFQVVPHFLRRSGSFARAGHDPDEILQLISQRVRVPPHFSACGHIPNPKKIEEAMASLEKRTADPGPPPEGLMPASRLQQWFFQALAAKMAAQERARLAEALQGQEKWADLSRRHTALLGYLIEKGSLEVDGVGFSRLRNKNEYRIYKRTGAFALKDFYGRPYIFPDCRVAVSTLRRLNPFVIEHYKHPLLRRHASGQEICLPKDFTPEITFSAAGVIQALEAGINALYYGYNARRRNGYHSLDRIHQMRVIDFDDYKVPPDEPRILSGEVEVKNIFT